MSAPGEQPMSDLRDLLEAALMRDFWRYAAEA
jgi:hypothetical protein